MASGDFGVVLVGYTDIDPFQRSVGGVIQHLPIYMVSHFQGGIILHIHGYDEMLDFISGIGCSRGERERREKTQGQGQKNS